MGHGAKHRGTSQSAARRRDPLATRAATAGDGAVGSGGGVDLPARLGSAVAAGRRGRSAHLVAGGERPRVDRVRGARRVARAGAHPGRARRGTRGLVAARRLHRLPHLHRPAPHVVPPLRTALLRPRPALLPARRRPARGRRESLRPGHAGRARAAVRAPGRDRWRRRYQQDHPARGDADRHRVGRRPPAPPHPTRGSSRAQLLGRARGGSGGISRDGGCWRG